MSGGGFILAINLLISGFLATAFLMIAAWDRMRVAARWLALAYGLGTAYYCVEATIPWFSDARLVVVLAFSIFLAATLAFNVGVARTYQVGLPWRLLLVVFVASVLIVWQVQELPRYSFGRMMAYQAPYFLMQAIGVGLVLSAPVRRPMDYVFAALLSLSALQFLSKPFAAHAMGGWGANPQAYLDSAYAMASQALGAVFAVAIALMMLVLLVRDLLADVTEKSETDTLSGLLNRRGFEQRAHDAIGKAAAQGLPVSLLIADMDHFKTVNDSYGHAVGDRAIASFAGFLGRACGEDYVAGRIGGEEFAILMPGANSVAGRLFAEGLRAACGSVSVEGLPPEHHLSASFGVAERLGGESVADVMRRADMALYEAKNAGRDCVRVAATGAKLAQVIG